MRTDIHIHKRLRLAGSFVAALAFGQIVAEGAGLPAGFSEALVANGLISPTAMQIAPDGRIFVCQQGGQIRVIKNGALLQQPFATLSVDATGERGLLGLAFDPNFTTNRYVYVYYITPEPAPRNRVSRITANGDVAVAGSELVLFQGDVKSSTNHLGGAMDFGPDGKLYIAVGDNGDPTNAQSMANMHGKMLRINRDGTIPTDNPFYVSATGLNRAIWALGLRNPFTFAFNRTGPELYINDVGLKTWEEIDLGVAGGNYGWPDTEGPTDDPRFESPIYAYGHPGSPWQCAITGGTFYSPQTALFPSDHLGDYFFADYCAGWIQRLDPSAGYTVVPFATGIASPVDLKVDQTGHLYYLARGFAPEEGAIYRIDYGDANAPTITSHPASQSVMPGASVTFSVRASGPGTLRYQWQRNLVNIAGATSPNYTIASVTESDNGAQFHAVVSNAYGNVTSNDATLTVSTNRAPTGTITQPAAGTLYSGGSVITVAATGTDPEDGSLPGSGFTWRVDFHHDTHTHPFIAPTSGMRSGSFTIPTVGETDTDVFYRIHLTVTDSEGFTHTSFRDVLPRIVHVTVNTSPPGLQVRVDGTPTTTPYEFDGVVGLTRGLDAITPQSMGTASYTFASWSDGGTAMHDISTPTVNTTYTATYQSNSTGNGLSATYYNNADFTGTTVTRRDPTVDFTWSGTPAPGIDADTFSVRWTGQVQAPTTDRYTFYTQSDNGVRLWVNGVLLIDNWTSHSVTTDTGSISLTAGQRYAIRLEMYDNMGWATARLGWSTSSTPVEVVPTARLFP